VRGDTRGCREGEVWGCGGMSGEEISEDADCTENRSVGK
jgi:hypothetical protein